MGDEAQAVEAYLEKVLVRETLAPDGPELKGLRETRDEVKSLLVGEYGSEARIREAGSKAKGTMVQSSYDLDLTVYFERDSDVAGTTIKEIYEDVERVLKTAYHTQRKGPAIRLLNANEKRDLHVDVVPGRFVEGKNGDVFLYPSSTDKERLKTNLDVHVAYIRNSEVLDSIRLLKVWRDRHGVTIKTFALELLAVKFLKEHWDRPLADQLLHVWSEFVQRRDELTIEDPANSGNDLSSLLNEAVRYQLASVAAETLRRIDAHGLDGWIQTFGPVDDDEDRQEALKSIAVVTGTRTSTSRSWYRGG